MMELCIQFACLNIKVRLDDGVPRKVGSFEKAT
jgi:hypothetical protein